MAAEIRSLLEAHRKITMGEAVEALKAKFPSAKINGDSCAVAFYTARRKMGLGRRRKVQVRKPASSRKSGGGLDLGALQQARRFVAEVGDADTAIAALKQLQSLQI